MCIFEYIFANCSFSLKIIYVTTCLFCILYTMFDEKIANNFEEMVLLKANLPIFPSLKIPIRRVIEKEIFFSPVTFRLFS
ncbi:UNVERIFIED_CONTAM: hypothetical protein RMT77_010719 [Armadillidium vulgare]